MMTKVLLLFSTAVLFLSCSSDKEKTFSHISFDSAYRVEKGFELQLVTAEPLIVAPVAIDFDNTGRIWVVEMRGYMPDLSGNGEDRPVGRISILSDFDEFGVAQRSTVFLDSLVLPRALALVYGGLLYAEPPNLWFVEINNDKPGKRTLVDSLYADGGYVELQPNGLMMNIDNWIYSANSSSRYQLKGGRWIREATTFRGQWGISKDNFGRLYFNYNEAQLAGDHVLPNAVISNRYFVPKQSENRLLTDDQRVYPLHPTTVNRGYEKGILTDDSLLKKFTAACGPVVYRGNQFPADYLQNAFVCEPQANVVKRNILSFDSLQTSARQAWSDKEFIASTDEGFRPVNLVNAPDGSIYIIDMHRGVLEHRAVSSPYYRDEISEKKLDTLLSWGRILRVKHKDKPLDKLPDFENAKGGDLVKMLVSENGWVRDRAQQILVHRQDKSVVDQLQTLASDVKRPAAAVHALHVLNGLNSLSFTFLKEIILSGDPSMRAHALLISRQYASPANADDMLTTLNTITEKNKHTDLYVAASLSEWIKTDPAHFLPLLKKVSGKHADELLIQEAITSSIAGNEDDFVKMHPSGLNKILDSLIEVAATNKKQNTPNPVFAARKLPRDERASGMVLFKKTCAGCHGNDGQGIEHVGPPLWESQFVQGSIDRLALIILNGLEGPIHINNKEYRFNGTMPNFANNLNDEQIADIIRYIRNSYVTSSRKSISAARVKELREKPTGTLTEEKLLQLEE